MFYGVSHPDYHTGSKTLRAKRSVYEWPDPQSSSLCCFPVHPVHVLQPHVASQGHLHGLRDLQGGEQGGEAHRGGLGKLRVFSSLLISLVATSSDGVV